MATVFFSAAERVHIAKAGAEAERAALRSGAARARDTLTKAEIAAEQAQAAAIKVKVRFRNCEAYSRCRRAVATDERAQAALKEAKAALLLAESKATQEAPLKAPPWLLPAALDLFAFMAIWSGLAVPKPRRKAGPVARKPKARKPRPKAKPPSGGPKPAGKAAPKGEPRVAGRDGEEPGPGNVVRLHG